GRRSVEVVVDLLHILAVIALTVAEAEQALLQDRVLAVPESEAEAEPLLVVAEAGDAVLAPAIGAACGMVMGEIAPGIAISAVVLAHRAPLTIADIGTPFPPGLLALPRFLQALPFGVGLGPHAHSLLQRVPSLRPISVIFNERRRGVHPGNGPCSTGNRT